MVCFLHEKGLKTDFARYINIPVSNLYSYNIYALDEHFFRFRYQNVKAISFASAFFLMIKKCSSLSEQRLSLYCTKPRSGDLQLMGVYDGLSVWIQNGVRHERVLELNNGERYELREDGFKRLLD